MLLFDALSNLNVLQILFNCLSSKSFDAFYFCLIVAKKKQ